MPRPRAVRVALPAEMAVHDGLAYSLWLPPAGTEIRGGVVILHGAGSRKESHHDFARIVLQARFAAIAFDQRGHGQSEGAMDDRVLEDIATMAARLYAAIGDPDAPIVLRGSSMGGYLAIVAAPVVGARAVVAICPASADGLRRGLRSRAFNVAADVPALDRFLARHDPAATLRQLEIPVLLLHAEGDETVPVEHSRALADLMRSPSSRLITVPGGHHRSVQHDRELQAASLRFIERAVAAR